MNINSDHDERGEKKERDNIRWRPETFTRESAKKMKRIAPEQPRNSIARIVTSSATAEALGQAYFDDVPDHLLGTIVSIAMETEFKYHPLVPVFRHPGPLTNRTLGSIYRTCKRFKKLAGAYDTWADVDIGVICRMIGHGLYTGRVARAFMVKKTAGLASCRQLTGYDIPFAIAAGLVDRMTGLEILELPGNSDDGGATRSVLEKLADNHGDLVPGSRNHRGLVKLKLGYQPKGVRLGSVTFGSLVELECPDATLAAEIARGARHLSTIKFLSDNDESSVLRELLQNREMLRELSILLPRIDLSDIPPIPGLLSLQLRTIEYTGTPRALSEISPKIEKLVLRRLANPSLIRGIRALSNLRDLDLCATSYSEYSRTAFVNPPSSDDISNAFRHAFSGNLEALARLTLTDVNANTAVFRAVPNLVYLSTTRCRFVGPVPRLAKLVEFRFEPTNNYNFAVRLVRSTPSLRRLWVAEMSDPRMMGEESAYGVIDPLVGTPIPNITSASVELHQVPAFPIRQALPSLRSLELNLAFGGDDAWSTCRSIAPAVGNVSLQRHLEIHVPADPARAIIVEEYEKFIRNYGHRVLIHYWFDT